MMETVAYQVRAEQWGAELAYPQAAEQMKTRLEKALCRQVITEPLVRLSDAEAGVEAERLRFEGDLDKWMKTIGAGISGYQPEAYAVMDAACDELVRLRARAESSEALLKEAKTALEPFAKVVQHDISIGEDNRDVFRPMPGQYARAERITVGHLRAARAIHHKIGVRDE